MIIVFYIDDDVHFDELDEIWGTVDPETIETYTMPTGHNEGYCRNGLKIESDTIHKVRGHYSVEISKGDKK